MRKDNNSVKAGLAAGMRELPVNDIQRTIAIDTMKQAERISDVIVSVLAAGRRLFARVGNGGLLHNH